MSASDVPAVVGHGFLSTYWPALICFAICLALGAWFWVRRKNAGAQSKPLKRGSTLTIGVGAALAFILGCGALANTYSGYFPSVKAVQRWATSVRGETADPWANGSGPHTTARKGYTFTARIEPAPERALNPKNTWIYVPPGYDAADNGQRYPVVYLMHGAPGRASDWFGGGAADSTLDNLIESGALPPMIVVSGDGSGGDFGGRKEPLNRPNGAHVEDYLSQDVVAWVDSHLRTIPDSQHRVIGGMSAGGIGALVFALHSPEVYGGAIALMPYAHPYTKEITQSSAATADNSPLLLLRGARLSPAQKYFLGQGTGEDTAETEEIATALEEAGATVKVDLVPKLSHNWIAARTLLPAGLEWIAEELEW